MRVRIRGRERVDVHVVTIVPTPTVQSNFARRCAIGFVTLTGVGVLVGKVRGVIGSILVWTPSPASVSASLKGLPQLKTIPVSAFAPDDGKRTRSLRSAEACRSKVPGPVVGTKKLVSSGTPTPKIDGEVRIWGNRDKDKARESPMVMLGVRSRILRLWS